VRKRTYYSVNVSKQLGLVMVIMKELNSTDVRYLCWRKRKYHDKEEALDELPTDYEFALFLGNRGTMEYAQAL
jgi:hypothetical protein